MTLRPFLSSLAASFLLVLSAASVQAANLKAVFHPTGTLQTLTALQSGSATYNFTSTPGASPLESEQINLDNNFTVIKGTVGDKSNALALLYKDLVGAGVYYSPSKTSVSGTISIGNGAPIGTFTISVATFGNDNATKYVYTLVWSAE